LIGGVLIALIALFSEISGTMVPPRVYEGAAVLLIFYAMFLAWRDADEARSKAEMDAGGVRTEYEGALRSLNSRSGRFNSKSPSTSLISF